MQFGSVEAFAKRGPEIPVHTVGSLVCEECLLEPIRIIEHLAKRKARRRAVLDRQVLLFDKGRQPG